MGNREEISDVFLFFDMIYNDCKFDLEIIDLNSLIDFYNVV